MITTTKFPKLINKDTNINLDRKHDRAAEALLYELTSLSSCAHWRDKYIIQILSLVSKPNLTVRWRMLRQDGLPLSMNRDAECHMRVYHKVDACEFDASFEGSPYRTKV